MATKPFSATLGPWLTANLGKGWGAPLTGQDWAALKAAVEIIGAYSYSDFEGQMHCRIAFKAMVLTMQPSCRWLAFHAIAHACDWSTRWQIFRACGLEIPKCRECKYGPRPAPMQSDPAVAC